MKNVNKTIKTRTKLLTNSNKTLKDLFYIIHSSDDDIFYEKQQGYKINEISYGKTKECINKMATYLTNQLTNIQKHTYVGLMMENSFDWICIFWGLLMAGYKPMLMNVRLGTNLNNKVIDMLNIKVVISNIDYNINSNKIIIDNFDYNKVTTSFCDDFTWEDEIALSTSATSLNLKICVYNGYAITNQIFNTSKVVRENKTIKIPYKKEIKQLVFLPLYHVFGLMATYFWFAFFGARFVYLKDYSAQTITNTIKKHKVTHIFAVPLFWKQLYNGIIKEVDNKDEKTKKKFYKAIKLSNKIQSIMPKLGKKIAFKMFKEIVDKTLGPQIRFMITGGSYISPNVIETINAIGYPLYNGYGMSEIGITSVELRNNVKYRNLATIGKPFVSIEYKISDKGSLLVKGTSIATSIITSAGACNTKYDEWFDTNDVATKDKKGYYYINGRIDDVYIGSNGEKINPDVIEQLIEFKSSQRFSILGLDSFGLNKLTLIVEIEKDANTLKTNKLIEEIKNNISILDENNYKIDKVYVTYDKIASDNAIKVSRSHLKKLINDNKVKLLSLNEIIDVTTFEENEITNEVSILVRKIFAKVLNIQEDDIKYSSHFMIDLGGTSLEYLTLLVELKDEFEMDFVTNDSINLYSVKDFTKYIISKNK